MNCINANRRACEKEMEMEMDRACSQKSLVRNNEPTRHMVYHPQVGPD